ARADPEAALLGAADIAPARRRLPLGRRRWRSRRPSRLLGHAASLAATRTWIVHSQRCSPRRGPPAGGAPVRSRGAQQRRPARAARAARAASSPLRKRALSLVERI